jgi:cytochrome c oxidase cbb3-type subunit 3
MPEWETKLGNERIMLLAAYVYSLSDKTPQPAAKAPTATQVATTVETTAN